MAAVTLTSAAAQAKLVRILELLRRQRLTATQVADLIHIAQRWAYPYMSHLHQSQPKQIYIHGWVSVSGKGRQTPIYAAGDLPDAPRPRTLTGRERSRAYRNRIKTDPMRRDLYLAKKRAKYHGVPPPDPVLAALFGMGGGA